MKSLSKFITEAMMDVNSDGGVINGVEILGRDVDIKIDGTTINVEPKSNKACVFINGNKAKDINLTLNTKDKVGVQIDGGNAKNITIESVGAAVGSIFITNVAKCDTIDVSGMEVDGSLRMDTCKGVKTLIGPRGQFLGCIKRCANLQTLDLSAADAIGIDKAATSTMDIENNKALKNIVMPKNAAGTVRIDSFTAEELVKAGLKNLKGMIYCAGKEAIFEPGTIHERNFDATGALKKPYSEWKYLKNGKLTVPTL